MFILKQGVIKQGKTSFNNISISKDIFIYPNKNAKNSKKIDKSNIEFQNENLKENFLSHKTNHPNLYSKSLESPLYSIKFPNISADIQKQSAIKEAFIHSWNGYKKFCWNHDILHPVSKTCTDYLKGGLTIIDSLSTLIIMGLDEELEYSKKFIAKKFHLKGEYSLFEFIIRYLGGFISAYYLSDDIFYKKMAIILGESIYPIIEKKRGFFGSRFYIQKVENTFKSTLNYSTKFLGLFQEKFTNLDEDKYVLSEVGSFQMEFLALTELTGDTKFADLAMNVYRDLWNKNNLKGLISNSIGSCYDSYYEYIIKTYLQTRGNSTQLLYQYTIFSDDLQKKLVIRFKNFTCIGVKTRYFLRPSVEHFVSFAAGMLTLGSVKGNKNAEKDLKLAEDLAQTYEWIPSQFRSGLPPDHVLFNLPKSDSDSNNLIQIAVQKNEYKLRPEMVESLFWLWKFTGDEKYRNFAWNIFLTINKTCRVKNGFTSVSNLEKEKPDFEDEMDSFFLAETLKYLYLIFSDSTLLSPVDWVFNTEGHPFKMMSETTVKKIADILEIKGYNYNYNFEIDLENLKNTLNKVKRRGIIKGPFDEKKLMNS